jgi:hypothetical protein
MRFVVRSGDGIFELAKRLSVLPMPFVVEITEGETRRSAQNNLAFRWYQDIAKQRGEGDIEDYRAYCKLHFGVGIMKGESAAYAEKYDKYIKPMPYEQKLDMMKEPIAFPVTSLMTVKQMTRYLDKVSQHWTAQGVRLTDPEALKYENLATLERS